MKNPFQFKYPLVKVVRRDSEDGGFTESFLVNPETADTRVNHGTLLHSNILEFALLELTKGKE